MVAWKRTSCLIAALAVTATLTACGSQPPRAIAKNSPAVVVHLGLTAGVASVTAGFSPAAVRLRVGQPFLLTVSPSVQIERPLASPCGSGGRGEDAGGLLSVRCAPGGYLYTAEHPGTGIVSVFVGPRCSPGQICPQWLAVPELRVTIT